jgi:hypothetical protein
MEITIADHWPQVIPYHPSCPHPENRQWRPSGPAFALALGGQKVIETIRKQSSIIADVSSLSIHSPTFRCTLQ